MQIVQDYKDLQEARQETVIAKRRLNEQFNNMLAKISMSHFGHNYAIEAAFVKSMPDPKIKPEEAKKYLEQFAPYCHSYPCFFVLYNPFGCHDNKTYSEKNVIRCINNREDGTIYESFCGECPAFENLVEYQSLKANLQTAQKKQENAKQKLLDNFRFWKQKVK